MVDLRIYAAISIPSAIIPIGKFYQVAILQVQTRGRSLRLSDSVPPAPPATRPNVAARPPNGVRRRNIYFRCPGAISFKSLGDIVQKFLERYRRAQCCCTQGPPPSRPDIYRQRGAPATFTPRCSPCHAQALAVAVLGATARADPEINVRTWARLHVHRARALQKQSFTPQKPCAYTDAWYTIMYSSPNVFTRFTAVISVCSFTARSSSCWHHGSSTASWFIYTAYFRVKDVF